MPVRTKTRTSGKSGQRSQRYTRALMLLTRKIWHDDCTLGAALAEICEGAAAALEVQRVNIWRYDSSDDRLVCLHAWCADTGGHAAESELETIALDGSYSALLDEARVIDAADVVNSPVSSDDELAAYYRRHGICSLLDAPVRMQGHLVGVICHEQTQCARPWAQEEQTFAASMGDFVAMAMEIQRRRDAEHALEHQRLHDMGTDLPNREYFLELLRLRLRALRAGEQLIAVVHIAIALPYATTRGSDGPTVDDVMTGVADVLRQSVGAECSIARVRADGFALLPQRHTSEVDVTELAERCVALVLNLSPWHDTEVGAAVGVAFSREVDEGDARVLMRRAEQAAHLAAARGRYEYEVFDIEHHRGLVERLHLEQALRTALVEDA
ncbi:MAG: GAF domain-containing protein, partial [Lysobacterales bacterium]